MRLLFFISILTVFISCKDNIEKTVNTGTSEESRENSSKTYELYENKEWNFSLQHPEDFLLAESELPGNAPVINVYHKNSKYDLPFAIHEAPENAYLAILPKGFGVDTPSGKQVALEKTGEKLDLNIAAGKSNSYLLASGKPWAYFLRFKDAPENWGKDGGVFVHFPIQNFKVSCENSDGEPKNMEDCDPMGSNEVYYSGSIDPAIRSKMIKILESFQFKASDTTSVSEVIKIEKPLPNIEVNSPLEIKGKARGYWFFEATAKIELQDKDYHTLAESSIRAKADWMTGDFVEFTGSIEFDSPNDERGYLVFQRTNPSDKKENEMIYKLPVIFPPKN